MLKERTKTGRIIHKFRFRKIELEMTRKVLILKVLGQNLAAKPLPTLEPLASSRHPFLKISHHLASHGVARWRG